METRTAAKKAAGISYPRRRFVPWYLRHGDGRATDSRESRIVLAQMATDVAFVVTLCVFGATMLLVG
jgi:hypothetical protein